MVSLHRFARRGGLLTAVLAALFAARLAPAQDWATKRLDESPRHLEWVELHAGDRVVRAFVAYPEVAEPAPAVIVIHEIFGLTDWVRSVADRLAENGYVAIAPDLLSGAAPGGGGSSDFASVDAARGAIGSLPEAQITGDLDAAFDHVRQLPAASGEVSVAGFCWGGSQSFRYATHNPKLAFACVFYGTAPAADDELAKISCPVFGFYAQNDARVTATLRPTMRAMNDAGKTFEPIIYEGAGHGFLRVGDEPGASGANRAAFEAAWRRWLEKLAGQ